MDNQKKPSKYGTLYHKPEHYERLWMLESSRKPEYLNNTFEADNERAGGMQLRRIAFDELQNKGYFKDRKYEEITPNEAMAGAMKYSSIIADNYGLTNEYWNALAFKEGPTAIKALYDKHGGNLKKAMGDPALRTEGREYLTKYLKTKLSDQINEKPAYVKDMYKVILEGGDINSVDPKKYYVSPTVKKAQAGLETKKEDNGFELNKMLTMPGMTKYTAGLSPVASAMANSIGLNGQTKGDLLGGAGMGALSGFLSGGPLGAILGGAGSLLTYGSNMAAKQLAEKEGREAEIKSKTIPGREGMEMPLMYGQMGGNVPTASDTLALQQNAVAIQNAVLKMHGTENFPVANRTINPNKDGSHVDDLDIPTNPTWDSKRTIIPIDKNKYYMKEPGLPDDYPPTLIDKRIAPNSIQHIFYPPTLGKPGQYDPRDDGKRVYIVPNYDYKQQQGGEVVPRLLNNFIKKYSGGGFSTEGYRSDSPDVDNAMNIIPGGNISMKDVNFPITAYPMSNGQIQGPYMMTPDKEYNFSTADAVIEIPEAQMGKPVTRDTIFPNASNKALFDMYSKGDNRPKYIINENQEGTPDELSTLEKGLKYADDIMSAPSRGMVKLITGKYQDPSEAWGYENPQGFLQNAANVAIDMIIDPMNLVPVGAALKGLGKSQKVLETIKPVVKGTDKYGNIIIDEVKIKKYRDLLPSEKTFKYIDDPRRYVNNLDFENIKKLQKNPGSSTIDELKLPVDRYFYDDFIVNKTNNIGHAINTVPLVNDVIDIKKGKAGYNKNTPVYEDQGWGPLASGYKNAVPTVSKGIKKKVNNTSKPSIIKQAVTNVENKVAEEKQIVIPQHSKMVNGQRIPITEKEANEIMSKGKVSTAPGQTIKEKDRKNVYIKPLQQGGYVQGETYELDDKEIQDILLPEVEIIGKKRRRFDTALDVMGQVGSLFLGKKYDSLENKYVEEPLSGSMKVALDHALNVAMPIEVGSLKFFENAGNKLKSLIKNKNASSFNNSELLNKLKQFDYKMNQPKLNNKDASAVLNDFKTRIKTTEGTKRAKALGIESTDLLDNLEIYSDNNTLGSYSNDLRINLNKDLPEFRQVTRHEIEHGVQDVAERSRLERYKNKNILQKAIDPLGWISNEGTTNIDRSLEKLELRKTPQKVDWKKRREERGLPDPNQFYNYLSNKTNATNYFDNGSQGKEKSAMLAELQQYMVDTKKINHAYDNITPEIVKNTHVDAMFDDEQGGKFLRILNIMKANDNNYNILADNLNKMLSVAPLAAAGAINKKDKKQEGGYIQGETYELDDKEIKRLLSLGYQIQ